MAEVFKWLMRIAGGLIALALLVAVGLYFLLARSLPNYNQTLEINGLSAAVEVVRDNANVPHIFGESEADVFQALGYAHAQDRLWQMTTLRRSAQGRLSEVFGPRSLAIDRLLRRFDIYTAARRSVQWQDPATRAALEAYARGVNARLEEINNSALGRGAPEMFLFNAPIAPWVPADSIAIIKLLAVQLSPHMQNEVLRARTSLMLDDPARLEDIMPDAPGGGLAALPKYASFFAPGALPRLADVAATPPRDPLSPIPLPDLSGASNAFAAAPERSASGGTLLANDPHLGLTAPSIWYLARLELASGGVIGATIPGVPLVLSGRSDRLGWGITSAYLDDQDVHIEQLNPDNSAQYRTPDGYADFVTRRSIIKVKGEKPVTLTLRHTENGPVFSGSQFNLASITPPGHVASLSWTALSPRDTTMSAGVALMRAATVDEALKAGEKFIAPAQVLTVVDKERIALKLVGAMPRRSAKHDTEGRLPSRGWIAHNRWQGRYPYSANPEFIDPPGGILGNTNNKIVDRPFPLHVSYLWGDTQRVHRWQKLMQGREVHTRGSFVEAQLDTVSFTARSLLPLIGADLWFTGESAPKGTPLYLRQRALELLAEWNGDMNEHRPEPLIYAAWLRALGQRLIQDELGPLASEFTHTDPVFVERVFRDIDGASEWCDIKHSSPVETCSDIARLALDDALIWITERYGSALESLRWGDAHQATHDHPVLGSMPGLSYFVNIRQSTGGGDHTLDRGRTSGVGPNPFQNVHAAGYRGVYDFADPGSSVFIISTGQSGHFLSRHYDDLAQLWRRGEYIPMSLDPDLARAGAVGITVLKPKE